MTIEGELPIQCRCAGELGDAIRAARATVTEEIGLQFGRILRSSLMNLGLDGTFEAMNGKKISAIVAEGDSTTPRSPIDSGSLEGIKYYLYERPSHEDTD